MAARRGFIIAIQTYPKIEGLAQTLDGTHAAAERFRRWLLDEQNVAPSDIYICADPGFEGATAGATQDEIVDELIRLAKDGRNKTEELYVLLTGHGLSYKDVGDANLVDVLLMSNYSTHPKAGGASLDLTSIQRRLQAALGTRSSDHFYFIDACRTQVDQADITPGTLSRLGPDSGLGAPTVHTLLSTAEGAVASVESGFIDALVDGLKGAGRAKQWRAKTMAVLFGSVKDYVEKRLPGQPLDERKSGGREGLIRLIDPAPKFTCRIVVQDASLGDRFTLTVSDIRSSAVLATLPFTGPLATFTRVPDDYDLAVSTDGADVLPVDPLPADLYDDRVVRFQKRQSAPEPRSSSDGLQGLGGLLGGATLGGGLDNAMSLIVDTPEAARVLLHHAGRLIQSFGATGLTSARLVPGRHTVEIQDHRGVTVKRETIDLSGPAHLDLRKLKTSPLREGLLRAIPGNHQGGTVDFSESLGPTPDQGLDLWLAVIGASRIVGGSDDFSKLFKLPLASFADAAPGASPVYLLAGFDKTPNRFAVLLSAGAEPAWKSLPEHPQLPGLFQFSADARPGYNLLSLQHESWVPITVGVCTLPNRATLVIVTADDRGALRVQQFMLPIKHLSGALTKPAQRAVADWPLQKVRTMVEIQRHFARSEELGRAIPTGELGDLLFLKWFEPIASLLAAYELARRGETQNLREVVGNLRQFFAGIPDAEAIAKMAGLEWQMPEHPPLILDGLLALDMPAERLPLPSARLDFRGPWTAWQGAVGPAPAT